MAESGIDGSDESFISFAFAVVSVAMIVLYIPWMINLVRGTVLFYKAPKKARSTMVNPLDELRESVLYIPRTVRSVASDPSAVVAGAKVCIQEKVFFLRCVMPKFLKFIIRPRILVLWLWIVLFSSAMYATLTFDPHAILGLSAKATTADVKRAYRSMSKRYHPDQNKTEEAREIYVQVRRAYKALVDREAFEEEEAKNVGSFSVGVALPRFLTSREHDGLVLFGLLAVLIVVPLYIWHKFTNDKKLPKLLWHIRFDKERVEHFMKHFGIPEDPKFVERRDSHKAILQILIDLQLVPPNVREDVMRNFPPLPDFIKRCMEAEHNMTYFKKLGLNEQAVSVLHTYMVENGLKVLDELEKQHPPAADEEAVAVQLVDPPTYKATRYLFQQHTMQVDSALAELLEMMGNNVPSARKLLNLHEEIYDLLDMLYSKPEKPNKQIIAKLMAMPQRVNDVVDSIEPEIELAYRRYMTSYLQQVKGGKPNRR